ncbi:GtrA family protein [Streptomyces broussonetiae]|uniref:GtrA family protein n=1 Tax=Streptomyces broussonetiae TaxID=2686304 RepID=A0A6I6N9M6_9ACTN|nr:GtrA family protein [Streptomyces broussonetiae]QHA05046.1 GtrA family protein [Streptomyces broussonetiae]
MTLNLEARPAPPAPAPAPAPASGPVTRVVLEIVKFGVVGGSGVLVNFLIFNLLLRGLGWQAMTATVLASGIAMATNYVGFRFFAYRDRASRTRSRIMLFFAFSGLGVVMEIGLFWLGYHGLGLHSVIESNAAKALSIVLASTFRFVVYRTWVFQQDADRTI